jgi:RNA polymerase sigma factor (sigma-70 family)
MNILPVSRQDEEALVAAIVRGEEAAMLTFYERYKRLAYSTINSYDPINASEADDYFQGFFAKLMEDNWRRLNLWEGKSKLSTYFVGILKNYILDQKRKLRANVALEDAEEISVEPFKRVEAEMDLATLKSHLKDCVDLMNERDKKLFELHFVKEQPAGEACDLLALSKNAFYKAVHDTRKRLSDCMSREFPFLFSKEKQNG